MFIDEKKYQMHLTGILRLTPGDHGWFLDLLKADTAHVHRRGRGDPVPRA